MSLLGRIKELREQHNNISINKLEKEAGLTRGSMAKWDDHAPSYDKLKKVADYFHVDPHYLLTGEEPKKLATLEDSELSEVKRRLIEAIINADDETAAALAQIMKLHGRE